MKCFCILAVVAFAIGFSEAMTKQERETAFKAMVVDCAAKEGAPNSEVESILAHRGPSTYEGKCIGACFGEATGTIKNNKMDVETLVAMAKMGFDGDAAKMDLARELSTNCADITDGERCEAAFKIFGCMKDQAIAKGLTPDDF